MSEDKTPDVTPEDELSKEFDELVEKAHDRQPEKTDEGFTVEVRRDTTPLDMPVAEPKEVTVAPTPVAPIPEASKPVAAEASAPVRSSGGAMVLQWLSYAFWGWFGVAMAVLTGVAVAYYVTGNTSDITSALAYPLASVIVMYLLALGTDIFYARREPEHKQGGPNAIMLIHVVLFVLIAVGAMVTALFSLISMALNTDPTAGTDGQVITAWTSLVVIITFGLIAVRALFGGKKTKLRLVHWVVMSALALGMIIGSVAGPVVGAQLTKDDRLIEEGLPALNQAITEYVNENSKLPATLADANDASTASNSAATSLVSRNLVKYTANVKEPTKSSLYGTLDKLSYETTYYYQLCVTYKQAKKSGGVYYEDSSVSGGKYRSYLNIYTHAKGEVCYDMKASDAYGIAYPLDAVEGSTTTKQ